MRNIKQKKKTNKRKGEKETYQILPGRAAHGAAQQQPTNEARPKTKANPTYPFVENSTRGVVLILSARMDASSAPCSSSPLSLATSPSSMV
jgi:hypothetical protein